MHRIDRERVHQILHEYKKECYLLEHHEPEHESVEKARDQMVDEILQANFHYEFHKPPNPERAEVLGMIENYTREAVLPPVLSKLMERIVLIEKRQDAGVRCMERLIALIEESLDD